MGKWKSPSAWCKECTAEYQRGYRERNKDKARAYRERNKEKLRAYRKKYQASEKWRKHKPAYDRAYRIKHKDRIRVKQREYNRRERLVAIAHYGNVCACCGEDRIEFLSIDHIHGGGQKHRKSLTVSIYRWLKREGYPEGFRILCHNCNMSLGFYGYCPHQKETQMKENAEMVGGGDE